MQVQTPSWRHRPDRANRQALKRDTEEIDKAMEKKDNHGDLDDSSKGRIQEYAKVEKEDWHFR